jgi:hypothetical protein
LQAVAIILIVDSQTPWVSGSLGFLVSNLSCEKLLPFLLLLTLVGVHTHVHVYTHVGIAFTVIKSVVKARQVCVDKEESAYNDDDAP